MNVIVSQIVETAASVCLGVADETRDQLLGPAGISQQSFHSKMMKEELIGAVFEEGCYCKNASQVD